MTAQAITAQIVRYRTICLAHRYLYYVKAESIISDVIYDGLERKLRDLIDKYPDIASKSDYNLICPTTTLGSDLADTYPRRIKQMADTLLAAHKKALRTT